MTVPVDGPLTEAEVRELLAIAHLAPLAVDYDDVAWTAAGRPSDQATRNARDRFARVAPRLARDLLGARERIERLERELAAAQKQPVILDLMDAMRAGTLMRERDTARAEVERLTRERDAARLDFGSLNRRIDDAVTEIAADRDRLRAALAELGPREGHATWCKASFPPQDTCTCGADAHNAKVAAALDVKP